VRAKVLDGWACDFVFLGKSLQSHSLHLQQHLIILQGKH
jgi:hypothetical protein